MLPRRHWQQHLATLDPERDHEEIYRVMLAHEFPWDMTQALSFALFRTYAVPSIGALLDRTGELEHHTQKRYDDTALLLDEPLRHGLHSRRGLQAIRQVNRMHVGHDISAEDMRYVLATFVVVPKRWMDDYGWRPFSAGEVLASVRYYRELGALMGISEVPATYAEFESLLEDVESRRFGFDPGGRPVADATMRLMLTFYPRVLARATEAFSRSLMDDRLLAAFGYRRPSRTVVALSRASMRARARVLARLPARARPLHTEGMRRIRSYPDGFALADLGTCQRHGRGARAATPD